jgi:hypothetical protein
MRWERTLPDIRTHAGGPIDDDFHTPAPGEKELPKLLKDDLSILPRALRACQELGLSIWMRDTSPRLKHKDLGIDFTSSKISRPAMWITQEVVRKLALNSFKSCIQCSKGWREIENSPSSNHWLNWATSRYDDALLGFAIGARLYTINTPGRLKKIHPDTWCDIKCQLCGLETNPDLFHILSECQHGGPATMLDRHNRVAYAVRKAIEIGNPKVKISEDKTVLGFCTTLTDGRRLRPDLTFESAEIIRGRTQNTFHFVEIAVPWSYEGQNGSALISACRKKVGKYQETIAELERKKPGYKVTQTIAEFERVHGGVCEDLKVTAFQTGSPCKVYRRCCDSGCLRSMARVWEEDGS